MKIEFERARNGQRIFKIDGRHICSSVDPGREGRHWAELMVSRCLQAERILILGLGCAYHVTELARQFPRARIRVIECAREVADAARKIHGLDMADIEIVVVEDVASILSHSQLQPFWRSGMTLLEYRPSFLSQPGLFNDIRDQLIARDPLYFSAVISKEKEWNGLFRWPALTGGEQKQLLTIKDLAKAILPDTENYLAAGLVRALRELVT